MNILKRKQRGDTTNEYILIYTGIESLQRFCVGTASPESLAQGSWFWGHYFELIDDALAYFNSAD